MSGNTVLTSCTLPLSADGSRLLRGPGTAQVERCAARASMRALFQGKRDRRETNGVFDRLHAERRCATGDAPQCWQRRDPDLAGPAARDSVPRSHRGVSRTIRLTCYIGRCWHTRSAKLSARYKHRFSSCSCSHGPCAKPESSQAASVLCDRSCESSYAAQNTSRRFYPSAC